MAKCSKNNKYSFYSSYPDYIDPVILTGSIFVRLDSRNAFLIEGGVSKTKVFENP